MTSTSPSSSTTPDAAPALAAWPHLDAPEVHALCARAADLGLVINVLAGASQADEVRALLNAFPSYPMVIEHALGINRTPRPQNSVQRLSQLASASNAVVELCDLPFISEEDHPFRDVHEPYLRIIDAFGADRCVWGSSFPGEFWVGKASQAQAIEVFSQHLPFSDDARAAILGGTAARLWFSDLAATSASRPGTPS